ncbi:uncharacterized protein LOC114432319 [Parambassis ranga]|uniref:Uncharacterized protein LOC114432319 n=1 Tax=Parambassis ranga TaxID=210632 RepID=A0A6P7I6Q7_9TELE|nr:uncharacterized protein LOC114432319 [Parambassis ranga]
MAEESTVYELEGLEKQLESLLRRYSSDKLQADSEPFCSDFCKLVEEYTSRWQVPLPQLRILEIALCYFAQVSTFFTPNCEHVLNTLSSLALSVFELLLFFDQKDFHQEPLKNFTVAFLECFLALAKHQNVHLHQVEHSVRGNGPWASPALQAILSESSLPQNEVDECIGSELSVFFELRVRYLLSCERVSEAVALSKCCARHPTAGQHLFFLQVYLTWLYKTSQHDRLRKEVADLSGKDAVHIICSLEHEEKNELLLDLSTTFLSQQLRRGDMYYLCDLVFVWSKLHNRLKTSRQALLQESRQLMLFATNVNSIFPFIRAILQEVGEDGVQFCVELCANALESCLPCDVLTKSLIYKTIAGLLPNDLEVCRACALLVFFLERTVESYKMVYLLYMHPDQEYDVEYSLIRNHVRFEVLQVLKKDLYFDPEFWNLIALRTNCLKLMSEKVVSSALEEIMEDKWISSYCTKEPVSRSNTSECQRQRRRALRAAAKKRHHKEGSDTASKRLKVEPGKTRPGVDNSVKKKGNRPLKEPLRRSFWQLDRIRDNVEHRRTTRLSEKNPPKRRIRQPRWLMEDSGKLEDNVSLKMKKHGHERHHRSAAIKKSDTEQMRNNSKYKSSVNSEFKANDNKHQGFSVDSHKPPEPPQVILELSLPDNELLGTFTDDITNRHRGLPQVLLYKPMLKLPATVEPVKAVQRKEVVLRARDATMFLQQLHCYARREKGKGNGVNNHGSVSTITRSSAQGSPPKNPPREAEGGICSTSRKASPAKESASQKLASAKVTKSPKGQNTEKVSESTEKMEVSKSFTAKEETDICQTDRAGGPCEEPAVEMKVTIASQSPVLDKVSKAPAVDDISKAEKNQKKGTDEIPPVHSKADIFSQSQDEGGKKLKLSSQAKRDSTAAISDSTEPVPCKNDAVIPSFGSKLEDSSTPSEKGSMSDITALTLVTEMVTELAPEQLAHDPESDKFQAPGNSVSKESTVKPKVPHKAQVSVAEQGASIDDMQGRKGKATTHDLSPDQFDADEPETEESKLEYCCTFCNKEFRGSRVVAHAMFHYRKDECMFCGIMFKDDLLAMIHLSDHIEKLKRIKELEGVPDTKDGSTLKTSAKARTAGCQSKGRTKRAAVCPKSRSQSDSNQSESRKLRSNDKPGDGPSLQEKQNVSKQLHSKTAVHKVNGHIGKKKDLDKPRKHFRSQRDCDGAVLQENKDIKSDSSQTTNTERASPTEDKMERSSCVDPQEKVSCPMDGCSWFTDVSKNRVALLYHALDDHYGEIKPLELAFRIGHNKCSICMRVLMSFEHFQHHVERHRLTPRHPCLHQGCKARFKTGIEMRRHTRKHNPLQAVCCLPGCSQLFICLWALNLHEREHYAAKSDKNTNVHRHNNKKQQDKTECTLKEQTSRKRVETPSVSSDRACLIKQEAKDRSEGKDSNVLKNLSNKDTCSSPALSHPQLRRAVRKVTTQTAPRVISSSLLKHRRKVRHKLKKKQVKVKGAKRRGRPPKHKTVYDENSQKNRDQRPSTATSEEKAAKQFKEEEEEGQQIQEVILTKSAEDGHISPGDSLEQTASTVSDSKKSKFSKKKKSSDSIKPESRSAVPQAAAAEEPADEEGQASELLIPSNTSSEPPAAEKTQKAKTKKSVITKEGQAASSDLGKTNKKHKDTREKKKSVKVKQKDKKTALKKRLKAKVQPKVEDTGADLLVTKEEASDSPGDSSGVCVPAENLQKAVKRENTKKNSEKKRKDVQKGDKKTKKQRTVPPIAEVKLEDEWSSVSGGIKPSAETSPSTISACSLVNGQAADDCKSTVHDMLAKYSKKPYMRLPPTAYLDEKYITMPKRRKEPFALPSLRSPLPEHTSVTPALQRQRCASCFATFSSGEELQSHIQLQKCSKLFGFESDDEDN